MSYWLFWETYAAFLSLSKPYYTAVCVRSCQEVKIDPGWLENQMLFQAIYFSEGSRSETSTRGRAGPGSWMILFFSAYICPIPGIHIVPAPPCPEPKTPGTTVVTLTLHCLCTSTILQAEGFYYA